MCFSPGRPFTDRRPSNNPCGTSRPSHASPLRRTPYITTVHTMICVLCMIPRPPVRIPIPPVCTRQLVKMLILFFYQVLTSHSYMCVPFIFNPGSTADPPSDLTAYDIDYSSCRVGVQWSSGKGPRLPGNIRNSPSATPLPHGVYRTSSTSDLPRC